MPKQGIDFAYILKIFPQLLMTVPFTVFVILIAAVLGLLFGVLVTLIRVKKVSLLYQITLIYISFTRSTPGLIQLFVVYYGLPVFLQLFGININSMSRTAFAILSLVLHNGAFVSEVMYPAYLSVDKGQHEAADSIGMTWRQKLQRIIAPQFIPIALPNLGNMLVNLIKDTSLLFTIGVVDLMGKSKIIIANDYGIGQLEVYITIAFIYWSLTFVSEKGIRQFERIAQRRMGLRHV